MGYRKVLIHQKDLVLVQKKSDDPDSLSILPFRYLSIYLCFYLIVVYPVQRVSVMMGVLPRSKKRVRGLYDYIAEQPGIYHSGINKYSYQILETHFPEELGSCCSSKLLVAVVDE